MSKSNTATDQALWVEKAANGVASVTLNRPDKHNAFDDQLIADMIRAFEDCAADAQVRVLVLQANGRHFSAGADLGWMKRMATMSEAENRADSLELARLMRTLNEFPKPTLACVQGAAFGGAVGLIACCDIAIATRDARFCLSETKLGLAPAVISPYVVAAMGPRACRRYFLTAEAFDAEEACRLGLVHRVVEAEQLETQLAEMSDKLLANGPKAMTAAKGLIALVANNPLDDALIEKTAGIIAALRVSAEGQEGLGAFFEKRTPRWPGH